MKITLSLFAMLIAFSSCQGQTQKKAIANCSIEKVSKSDKEWKKQLNTIQFNVARKADTERAFSGEYWDNHKEGAYNCVCCDFPLFKSDTKFESGTGWPSFWDAVDSCAVAIKVDKAYGMVREEVVCAKCDAHLGHVFDDGPKPTGKRYCMNSASLKFQGK